ncbi:MAG: phosphatase PAP2 family protein, partial [Actinomycetota bacterium]|nr:phosphatase PAP2 family protein [Actinomycetota bacterium]
MREGLDEVVVEDRRAAVLSAAAGLAFVVLTVPVVGQWRPLASFDADVLAALHEAVRDRTGLVAAMRFVSTAFEPYVVWVALLVVGVLLVRRGRRATGQWVLVVTLLEVATVTVVKNVFDRPRPPLVDRLHDAESWSYPSGHASAGALLCGVVAVLALVFLRRPRIRAVVVALGVGFALLL